MAKLLLCAVLFSLPQVVFSVALKDLYLQARDPRKLIFNKVGPGGYRCALLGDSVFSSCFVDNESQTLWKQMERESGVAVFPGALNGARPDDVIKASLYLGENLPAGSLVFIDAFPGRNWSDTSQNYKSSFVKLMGNYDYSWVGNRLSDAYLRLWVQLFPYKVTSDDLVLLSSFASHKKYFRYDEFRDRIWSRDGDFALNRFVSSSGGEMCYDFRKMDAVAEVLLKRGLKPVFVLTPFNRDLVDQYAASDKLAVRSRYLRHRDAARYHLEQRNYPFLDLTDAVPSSGFADLIHTNALGDSIMAGKMVERLKSALPLIDRGR